MLPVEYPYGGPVGSEGWGPYSPSDSNPNRRRIADNRTTDSPRFLDGPDRRCAARLATLLDRTLADGA